MSKIDDLHTLVRLLKEFELPVSPILEFAIQEKMEALADGEAPCSEVLNLQSERVAENTEASFDPVPATTKKKRAKATILRVTRANGSILERETATYTFCQTIREIGPEKVYDVRIPMDGMYLVTVGGNPSYPSAQHDLGNGYFANLHSSTFTKMRQLKRIFKELNLHWNVEIVESK